MVSISFKICNSKCCWTVADKLLSDKLFLFLVGFVTLCAAYETENLFSLVLLFELLKIVQLHLLLHPVKQKIYGASLLQMSSIRFKAEKVGWVAVLKIRSRLSSCPEWIYKLRISVTLQLEEFCLRNCRSQANGQSFFYILIIKPYFKKEITFW